MLLLSCLLVGGEVDGGDEYCGEDEGHAEDWTEHQRAKMMTATTTDMTIQRAQKTANPITP
jgi:hypothetical protein